MTISDILGLIFSLPLIAGPLLLTGMMCVVFYREIIRK